MSGYSVIQYHYCPGLIYILANFVRDIRQIILVYPVLCAGGEMYPYIVVSRLSL